jgi:hypothetical protein
MGDKVRTESMRMLLVWFIAGLFMLWFIAAGIYHAVTS